MHRICRTCGLTVETAAAGGPSRDVVYGLVVGAPPSRGLFVQRGEDVRRIAALLVASARRTWRVARLRIANAAQRAALGRAAESLIAVVQHVQIAGGEKVALMQQHLFLRGEDALPWCASEWRHNTRLTRLTQLTRLRKARGAECGVRVTGSAAKLRTGERRIERSVVIAFVKIVRRAKLFLNGRVVLAARIVKLKVIIGARGEGKGAQRKGVALGAVGERILRVNGFKIVHHISEERLFDGQRRVRSKGIVETGVDVFGANWKMVMSLLAVGRRRRPEEGVLLERAETSGLYRYR